MWRDEKDNSLKLMRTMLDSAPFVITLWNDKYECEDISAYTLKLFEFTDKREYIENFDAFSPERQPCGTLSTEKSLMYFERAFREGYVNFKWTHQTKSGEPVSMDITISRFEYDGRPMLTAYALDIREAEAALARERDDFELVKKLIDLLPFVMNMYNSKQELISTSEHVVRLFGVESQQEYLDNWFNFSPEYQPCGTPSDKKAALHVEEAFNDGVSNFRWIHQTKSGEPVPMNIRLCRFEHKGEDMLVTFAADLRELEATAAREREAQELVQTKSRFLAQVSHEMRTPMNAIMGTAEIQLQNPTISDETEEGLLLIHNSARLLLALINNLLDLSKVEAGKMEIISEPYETASLIVEIVQLNTVHLGNKPIEFSYSVSPELPSVLVGDEVRIKQIFNNLLSNAFKYTDEGEVKLSISCSDPQDSQITLTACISDTGRGMTEEQLHKLFNEEYVRFAHRHSTVEGTGLGISITNHLVEMMDGAISVESKPNEGTRITVRLPQQTVGASALGNDMAESLQKFDASKEFMKKASTFDNNGFNCEPMPYGKVLVVDDVDSNLYVARGLLAFYHLDIDTCASGYEAIDRIKQGKEYDVVFMDQMMPGLTGTRTMRMMRDMGYTSPIVLLTASALKGQVEEFLTNGFDGFITKPIKANHLNNILIKYIKDKQPPEVIEAARAANADKTITQSDIEGFQLDDDLVGKLCVDFARSQKNTYSEMSRALVAGDFETAHQIVHTLKGLAGLIRADVLAKAAGQVDDLLRDGKAPDADQLSVLEAELIRVLDSIGKPESQIRFSDKAFDRKKAGILFDKLTPLLKSNNVKCIDLLDELRAIPETAVLVRQIEEFDFLKAYETMSVLREIFEE